MHGADDTIETGEPTFTPAPSLDRFELLAASLDARRRGEGREARETRSRTRASASGTTLPGLQQPAPAPPGQREGAGHTQPFDRKILAGHATVVESLPSVIVNGAAERTQPTSIAPFAIDIDVDVDVEGSAAGPEPRERRSTVRIRKATWELRQLKARWIVGGVALVAGAIVAFASARPAAPSAAVSATTVAAAELPARPFEVPEQPHAEPSVLVPVTGVIVTRKRAGTLTVDGEKKRIEDGRVVVTCGRHRVGTGKRAQSFLVPCGGTTLAR